MPGADGCPQVKGTRETLITLNSIAGTGVGMYVIKRLVERNHGTIHLESKPNEGLTYFITLPLKMLTND
ncbi:MAG: sensor histidine kinase [Bacteroidetes bacterium]|nr:MAG: sensor histidine kinase [Bacteroidota bacterium]